MHENVLNFIGIGVLSALFAVATIIGNALRIDKDPAVDGPRALIAEFFGLWAAFAFLAWSFMIAGPEKIQWILRGIAGSAAIIGFTLAAYFAGTPEVQVKLDEDPSGFENPITALQLHDHHPRRINVTENSTSPADRNWSKLHPQP